MKNKETKNKVERKRFMDANTISPLNFKTVKKSGKSLLLQHFGIMFFLL